MRLPLDQIVNVLRLGLIGLAFLLAMLSYFIIRKEQTSKTPRAIVVRGAHRFLYQCMGLLVLVGALQVIDRLVVRRPSAEQIARCRDSLDTLQDRRQRAGELKDLQYAIDDFQATCGNVFREMEEKR
jgi:hypothetical protein